MVINQNPTVILQNSMNKIIPDLNPKNLFKSVFAGYFLLVMHYYLPNMGGYGLYLPYNVIGWMFIATLIGLGFWQTVNPDSLH